MSAAHYQLRLPSLAAFIAGVLNLIFNLYHFSLQGTGGLYTWHPLPMLTGILFMGLVPLLLTILYILLCRTGPGWLRITFRWLSLLMSALVSLVSIVLLAYLIIVPRMGKLEIPQLSLIDPARGIKITGPETSQSATTSLDTTSAKPLLRLSFSSDPHWGVKSSNAEARTSILRTIAQRRTDAFFMLGDTVETGNETPMWQSALNDLGHYIPHIPLRVLLGNHDALFGGQYLYTRAFAPRELWGNSGSPYYWSLNLKDVTIVAIDLPWGTENFGSRQRHWLEATLAAADPRKPIIVLSHSYFYASGYDDPKNQRPWYDHYQNIAQVVPLFEHYKVTLVISGHNHYQELLSHNGVTYAIVGSMGGIPDPKPTYISPASQWIAVGQFGWLDVDLFKDRLRLVFNNETGIPQFTWDLQSRTK